MKFIKQYWKPLAWTLIILILCLLPKSAEPQPSWLLKIPHFDKIVHFGLYAILSFLINLDRKQNRNLWFYSFVFAYCFCLGGFIEMIQPFVGRSKELMDLMADVLGSLCAILCFAFYTSIIISAGQKQ